MVISTTIKKWPYAQRSSSPNPLTHAVRIERKLCKSNLDKGVRVFVWDWPGHRRALDPPDGLPALQRVVCWCYKDYIAGETKHGH